MTKQQFIRHFIKGCEQAMIFNQWTFDRRKVRKYANQASKEFVNIHRIGNDLPF